MNNLSGSLSFHGNVSGQMGTNLITNVEANPTGTPTEILTSIRVGDIIYSIPSGGGGGGGTNNYNDLLNKPKINNIVLSGELSLSDLGIYNPVVMTGATGSADGAAGYAPKPLISDKDKFLKGDGTWADVSAGGFEDVILYESTAGATGTINNVVLNDDLNNYNAIYCEFFFPAEGTYTSSTSSYLLILCKTPNNTYDLWWYTTYGNRWFRISSSDGINATLYSGSWNDGYYPSIYRIHGVKF